MHCITVHASEGGWLLKRPGWPGELFDSIDWAARAAESLAFEFHQRSGRDACVVLASSGEERVLRAFCDADAQPGRPDHLGHAVHGPAA